MKCPVCANVTLVMSERQGIEIDYCPQCRGVWLDRGELDKIIERSRADAPPTHAASGLFAQPAVPAPQPYPQPQHTQRPSYPEPHRHGDSHHAHSHDHYSRKRKKSLWEELFD